MMLLLPTFLLSAGKVSAVSAGVCSLNVPSAPLSAAGLATPWQLQAPCHEANTATDSVFIQGVIFDETNRTLSTYSPLVIDVGTTPAIAPTAPVLPANSIVGLWGGGDDIKTHLIGPGASSCVNGAAGHVFGQVFFCGAAQFFAAIRSIGIGVPPIGKGTDGLNCPTTRSFKIVDQDQSDNVQTQYLANSQGQTAQDTIANRAALGTFTVLANGSDNRLLTNFVDPALNCHPWTIPDVANNGALVPTQATDELQAAAYQTGQIALVPAGDPMVGPNVLAMVNAYRQGVDQPTVGRLMAASTAVYCHNLKTLQPAFLANHKTVFQGQPSPTAGMNLYDFMQARLAASFQLLKCP